MKLADVLKKVADKEELSDEEQSFLADYKEPDIDAAANARSKKERLKLEKKLEDMQTELDAKDEALESAQEGGSDLEKLQKQIEKLTSRQEQSTASLKAEQDAHAATRRDTALAKVKLDWVDGVSDKYKSTVLTEAFADFDTDDLGNADMVGPIVSQIKESNATFIASGAAKGAGTGGEDRGAGASRDTGPTKVPQAGEWKKLAAEGGQKAVRAKMDAMWAEPATE